ncbi:hypothetical protein CRUP_034098, partial [Coryphaenoides rupestris]
MGVPSSGDFCVQRKVLVEAALDELGRRRTQPPAKPPLAERLKKSLRCTVPRLKKAVLKWVPVLSWLPKYSIKENALGDVISGLSVGIMHLPQGTFAVVSIMVGSVNEKLAPDSLFTVNGTNGTGVVDFEARDAYRVQVSCALSAMVGVLQILFGLVRFGFVVTYLSEPLVRGYTTAVAFQVLLSQLKYVIGVTTVRYTGPLSQIY